MTFDIEELKLAQNPLPENDLSYVINLIAKATTAHSSHEGKMVNFGKQSFIRGLHQAYADHRPFTLSPDIIWLIV